MRGRSSALQERSHVGAAAQHVDVGVPGELA
jgi:hypothetical protein